MTNTQMREFLEKELPEIKANWEDWEDIEKFSSALDKAVEDVRKLREFVKNIKLYAVRTPGGDISSILLNQTSWAEVEKN